MRSKASEPARNGIAETGGVERERRAPLPSELEVEAAPRMAGGVGARMASTPLEGDVGERGPPRPAAGALRTPLTAEPRPRGACKVEHPQGDDDRGGGALRRRLVLVGPPSRWR